jgi:hypothetical protein
MPGTWKLLAGSAAAPKFSASLASSATIVEVSNVAVSAIGDGLRMKLGTEITDGVKTPG